MRFELFKALNESIERLGNCWYEYDKGRYSLSWDYEWGQLTSYQEDMLEQAEKRVCRNIMEWYNSLSAEEKEWEDDCEYSDTFGYSDRDVAQEVVNILLPIDKEAVINQRRSLFNKKKAAIVKELKRISELSKEERKKLVADSPTI